MLHKMFNCIIKFCFPYMAHRSLVFCTISCAKGIYFVNSVLYVHTIRMDIAFMDKKRGLHEESPFRCAGKDVIRSLLCKGKLLFSG